ncbi:ribosomal protein S18 acetylase RimI-like enzyme [Haloactinopolyspora alba]|uniref:Ribosomal protein S18 acetylase RimI-like enzyme n=1 Tax=Haloactinopolyspora alba TaxID=648780 RepID=A0A2P8DX88_9ACTN|nr:GNAT family N-acetyltransferase [Haloactinopolyspora alba]PSL01838.1 ribosomal protein S18 acetylase RimI-like enzyme [Haloactinopolyspora alba]
MRQRSGTPARPELVGRRVVVRHRIHDQRFGATDVLGTLLSWSPAGLRVTPDRGDDVVEITNDDVIAVKAIPQRTVTRRDVRDLEAAAAAGWQALETEWMGGWLLRAADGFTRRANSCLPLDDPGLPLADAVDAVERWYRRRGLVPAFQVPQPLGGVLDPLLDTRGWDRVTEPVLVMTADLDDVAAAARADLPPVRIDDEPDAEWLAGYHYRGGDLPDHAVAVLTHADTVAFASVDDDGGNGDGDGVAGRRLAIARGAVTESPAGRRWLGLAAVEVVPEARRRGLGSHIVAGLATWAAGHGARQAYLQVTESNSGAQATYRGVGFAEHHAYHYRRLAPPES